MEHKSKRLPFEELGERLHGYERRYGYSTIEFYRRFQNGELGDDDDFMAWRGLFHLYLTSLPVRQFMHSSSILEMRGSVPVDGSQDFAAIRSQVIPTRSEQ